MSSQYISWVPNISGQLLFSLVDALDYRNDRIVGDVFECRKKRQEESVLKKNSLDPFLISMLIDLRDVKERKVKSGYTRLVFLANPNADGSLLSGKIGFFDDLKQPMLYKSDQENEIIRTLSQQLNYDDWEQSFANLKKFYRETKETKAYTVIEFELHQNGRVILNLSDSLKELDSKQIRADILQAYFFIKFIFHKDRFHDKTNEYIVPLLPFHPQYPLMYYYNRIIDTMRQYILSYRKEHHRNYLDLQSLKGILTYATALTRVLSKDQGDMQKATLSDIEHSLDLEISRLRPRNLPNLMDFLDDLKNWVVIVFAVITPFIIKNNKHYDHFWDYVRQDALAYYGIGIASIIVLRFLFGVFHDVRNKSTIKTCYLVNLVFNLVLLVNFQIKKHSRPSLAKWNLFTRIVFPEFVHVEMDIRRTKNIKKVIIASLIFVGLSLLLIYNLYKLKDKYTHSKQNQPLQIPSKPKQPLSIDLNKTLRSTVTR